MRRGLHVLVEKPLANTEQDVLAIAEAYRHARQGLKVQVGYILRFNPVFEVVHSLARAGQLGDIFYLEGDYVHNLLYQREKTDPGTGRNWYLEQERPMVGGGSHPLDPLRWISGQEVTRVTGFSNHIGFPEMRNDDCQVALFQFSGGTVANVAALYTPRLAMPPTPPWQHCGPAWQSSRRSPWTYRSCGRDGGKRKEHGAWRNEMSHRERVSLTLAHKQIDQVPIAMVCVGISPAARETLTQCLSTDAASRSRTTSHRSSISGNRRGLHRSWGSRDRLFESRGHLSSAIGSASA